jgi:hypothetical protein
METRRARRSNELHAVRAMTLVPESQWQDMVWFDDEEEEE